MVPELPRAARSRRANEPSAAPDLAGRPSRAIPRWLRGWWLGTPVILLLVLFWEFAVSSGWVNPVLFPPPSVIVPVLLRMIGDGTLFGHIGASGERALLGFAASATLGILLGMLLGWSQFATRFLGPLLDFLRQLPPLGIFPVFILFFGLGNGSKVAIVFWAAVWPILINTIVGVREVDPVLIKAARSLNLSRPVMFTAVVLPAAVPTIFAGLRLGATYSVLVLVGAEMIGANSGLGFLILQSQYSFRIREMYAAILVLGLVGYLLNTLLIRVEARVWQWKRQ